LVLRGQLPAHEKKMQFSEIIFERRERCPKISANGAERASVTGRNTIQKRVILSEREGSLTISALHSAAVGKMVSDSSLRSE
jgi:hypothetical protein